MMSGVAVLLTLVTFFVALGCYILRDFSRSRLHDICHQQGLPDRFGDILKDDAEALIVFDALLTMCAVVLFVVTLNLADLVTFPAEGIANWLSFVGRWCVLLLFASILVVVAPWTLSRVSGERILYAAWPIVSWLLMLARPWRNMVHKVDQIVHRLFGVPERDPSDAESLTEEIRSVVDEGQREGVLETHAGTMIQRVMELSEEDVAAIMTPRTDMVTVPFDASLHEARERILEAGHARLPIIGESTDDIVGVLYARDLLKHIDSDNGHSPTLTEIAREPFYIPETKGIDDLLETMKRRHVHMAIVVDEYSGVAGLVTMEDVLEEIVGEITDEYDEEEAEQIRTDGNGRTEVDARVHIDDLNEQFQFGLPEDGDFDTIGGFALSEFGRIPARGESFTWQHLRFVVLDANSRRLNHLLIEVDESLSSAAE